MQSSGLSFRGKLLVSMGVFLLLSALAQWSSQWMFRQQVAVSRDLSGNMMPRSELASAWLVSVLESARHTRNVLILDDPEQVRNELTYLEQEKQRRLQLQQQLQRMPQDAESRAALQRVVNTREVYIPQESHYIAMIKSGKHAEAKEFLLESMRPAQLIYKDQLKDYLDLQTRQLADSRAQVEDNALFNDRFALLINAAVLLLMVVAAFLFVRNLWRQLGGDPQYTATIANRLAEGQFDIDIRLAPGDDRSLLYSIAEMGKAIAKSQQALILSEWIKSSKTALNDLLQCEDGAEHVPELVLDFLLGRLGADVGALYFADPGIHELRRVACHSLVDVQLGEVVMIGEGLLGRAALQHQMVLKTDLPPDYLRIHSATGSADPQSVLLLPLFDSGGLVAMVEFGRIGVFSEKELALADLVRETLGVMLGAARARSRMRQLLETTVQQAEALQRQQVELEQNNHELREHGRMLDEQRHELDQRNAQLLVSAGEIEWRANELEQASQYKSDFLANMSHELRTPLNSMLMLSDLLRENRDQNLSEQQIRFAESIYHSGKDLLLLINDILDLSKIEAGKMDCLFEPYSVAELCQPMNSLFRPMVEQKGLAWVVDFAAVAEQRGLIDLRHSQQILKNLLSNALKFTSKGCVQLTASLLAAEDSPLNTPTLQLVVRDTGIGIAPEQLSMVFEAFRQADAGISRRFGGTGLGLSISSKLAQNMKGDLTVSSEVGQGSTFSLLLPWRPVSVATAAMPEAREMESLAAKPAGLPQITLLIVEDDLLLQQILADQAREHGLIAVCAADGDTALQLARNVQPDAILLDVMLPKLNGWEVMRHLQASDETVDIPVHFISGLDAADQAMRLGGSSYLQKPLVPAELAQLFDRISQQALRSVLIVEDRAEEARVLGKLFESRNWRVAYAEDGEQALTCLGSQQFGAMILDLQLPDMPGDVLLERVRAVIPDHEMIVIVHSAADISRKYEQQLRRYAQAVVCKGEHSAMRIMDELARLQSPANNRPVKSAPVSLATLDENVLGSLKGRTLLLVDDDIRNVFAISSLLTYQQVKILEAENGRDALEQLRLHPEIELVLMDIMMPEMDGYTAMRTIRQNPDLANLPIIAMTAKSMPGDDKLCLEAGASDYITKPLDNTRLIAMLLHWLDPVL